MIRIDLIRKKTFWFLWLQIHNIFETSRTEDHIFSESHHHLKHKSTHDFPLTAKVFSQNTGQMSKPNIAVKFQNMEMPNVYPNYQQVNNT